MEASLCYVVSYFGVLHVDFDSKRIICFYVTLQLEIKESEAFRSLGTQIAKMQTALKERELQLAKVVEQRDFLSVQLDELDRQNNEAMQV